MELIRTKDALVRLVINVLVIDLFCCTITAGQYHGIVTGGQTISSNDEDSIVVHSGLSSAADVDIDILLKQLKSELARDSSAEEDASYSYCYGEENCTGGQYCNVPTHQCMCYKGTHVDGLCPTVGSRCTSCCCGKNVYCSGEICELFEVDTVSSQMILSIVMVMGLMSIIFMVYRMCYRNSLQQRLLMSSAPRESPRPSLSSLQIGVMSRMRDRPPTYETRHNYQRRTTTASESQSNSNEQAVNHRGGGGVDNPAMEVCEVVADLAPIYINTPPPPYVNSESDERSITSPRSSVLRSDPPPYSVAIKEINQVGGGGGGENNSEGIRTGQTLPANDHDNSKELYI